MGVPKFFRFISERYPCLSEVVQEYQIPEFDNLYLDMNGIIHTCSHPDDNNPHFRISEEKIFQDIFHYIVILFRMIKPQKIFFMAIDGVAPRAKMNQQRSRRFRVAKDVEKSEQKALEKGEKLPTEARFDSNCITPGTVFMTKLHEQLQYFIVDKISNDPLWQKCKIILSGHETPGEGEHKIMDYIRYIKAQPGYDPNTRHCLYGLDADLIMLGLCTHEPHFSLLREEVRFGNKSTKKKCIPEQITFFLLHLSLMREYLELEFISVKDKLSFEFDIEKIIDDWVLMGFLVGNDFIPHLPNLHITNGSLPLLYEAYIKVLPSLNGYINESGSLNLGRFQTFMESLSRIDIESFSDQYADLKYFEAKTGRRPNDQERTSYKPKALQVWEGDEVKNDFVALESEKREIPMKSDLASLIQQTEAMLLEPTKLKSDELELEEECDPDESTSLDSEPENEESLFNAEFKLHKKHYYMNKLDYEKVTPEVMRSQAEGYVRAIQWNLHYYYNGVCSWSWYYPHHYAPYISDIKNFSDLELKFELGKPFQPYEQLLAVLPSASRNLLPKAYHSLMTDENSMIKSFYPDDFKTDLNGKKQEWEAVVLVPFIDEKILLEAMAPCNQELSLDEIKMNTHGPMLIYNYTNDDLGQYDAPEFFPPIGSNHAECTPIKIEDIRVPQEKLIKGLYPGVKLDVFYPGFPTMKHLQYYGVLERARVKVFEQLSRFENMILKIKKETAPNLDVLAKELLGTTVFVAWPHLVEALVVTVSNQQYRYHTTGEPGKYNVEMNKGNVEQSWLIDLRSITEYYKERLGIDVGDTEVLVHVKTKTGRKYLLSSQGRFTFDKQWCDTTSVYPLQTIVRNITAYSNEYAAYKDVDTVFPKGSYCFMLGHPHYGAMGKVLDSHESLKKGRVKVEMHTREEPNLESIIAYEKEIKVKYMPLYVAASKLAISKFLLSRITGTILVISDSGKDFIADGAMKVNVGLNLKLNKKNEEIPGYTRKNGQTWLYSEKTVELVKSYMEFCPELFEYLHNADSSDNCFENDLFPQGDAKEKLKDITNWLKKQEVYNIERQQCGTWTVDPDVVKKLEELVDYYNSENPKIKSVIMQVKPHLLFKPDLQIGNILPDSSTEFNLFDRIVNIRESYTVPFGLSGTIIAIHKTQTTKKMDVMYDVVFDKKFAGGLALNCSENRGYTLPAVAIINRSYGQRVLQEKTKTIKDVPQSKQITNRFINMQGQPLYKVPNQPIYPPYAAIQSNSAFVSWNREQQNYLPHFVANYPNMSNIALKQNGIVHQRKVAPKSKDIKPSKNLFMPTFKNDPSTSKQAEGKSPQVSVSTDLLKQMLKINDSTKGKSKEKPKSTVTNKEPLPPKASNSKVEEFFAQASSNDQINSELKLSSKDENTYNCKELAEYFQKNQLGLPRYQCFEQQQKQFQAQLTLPDESIVIGNPEENIANACEYVAGKVLKNLADLEATSPQSTQINVFSPPGVSSVNHKKKSAKNKSKINDKQQSTKQTSEINKTELKSSPNDKNTCYCKELWVYFQKHHLGLPQYQCFQLQDNEFQAQITLPGGNILIGKPYKSAADAYEYLAGKVLKVFNATEATSSQVSHLNLSTPSKALSTNHVENSVETQSNLKEIPLMKSPEKPKLPVQGSPLKSPHKNHGNNHQEGSHKTHKSLFVPLQAVRKHISKKAATKDNCPKEILNKSHIDDNNSQHKEPIFSTASGDNNQQSSNVKKPKRERKVRIAAKFSVAIEPPIIS